MKVHLSNVAMHARHILKISIRHPVHLTQVHNIIQKQLQSSFCISPKDIGIDIWINNAKFTLHIIITVQQTANLENKREQNEKWKSPNQTKYNTHNAISWCKFEPFAEYIATTFIQKVTKRNQQLSLILSIIRNRISSFNCNYFLDFIIIM